MKRIIKDNLDVEDFDICRAIKLLKKGYKVSRKKWGDGVYLKISDTFEISGIKIDFMMLIVNENLELEDNTKYWYPTIEDYKAKDWYIKR